jgi:ribokinase
LERATVVIANQVEAEQITGLADPARAAGQLGGQTGIVTLGGRGCVVSTDGVTRAFAAEPVVPVDTSGAGDIFCGVLAALLVAGATLDAAIVRAQCAAAIGVSRAGCFASFPSGDELAVLR